MPLMTNPVTGTTVNVAAGDSSYANAGWTAAASGAGATAGFNGSGAAAPTPPTGSSIINPGSVYQTYDPNTGKTTYGNAPAGFASGVNQNVNAPAVVTPGGLTGGAQVYQGQNGGYQPYGATTVFSPRTIDGKEVVTSDFALNPLTPAELAKRNSSTNFESEVAGAVNQANKTKAEIAAEARAKDVAGVNAVLADATKAKLSANANFINAAAQAYLGRNATKAEISAGGFLGKTTAEVAAAFKAQADKMNQAVVPPGGVAGANKSNPDSMKLPNSSIQDPTTGLIDYNAFYQTFLKGWQATVDKINAATEAFAAQEKAGADQQINLGEQVGEMPLLTGDMGEAQKRNEAKLNYLSRLVSGAQQEQSSYAQSQSVALDIMGKMDTQKQFLYNYARDLRQDQKDNLALMLQYPVATDKMTADQLGQFTKMASAIGIDPSMAMQMMNSVVADKIAAGMSSQIVELNGQETLVTTDKMGNVIKKTALGAAYHAGSGSGSGKTFKIGNQTITESGDPFTDTVKGLVALRDQNMLNDYNYNQAINGLGQSAGLIDEKGKVVDQAGLDSLRSLVNNSMARGASNDGSDYGVTPQTLMGNNVVSKNNKVSGPGSGIGNKIGGIVPGVNNLGNNISNWLWGSNFK